MPQLKTSPAALPQRHVVQRPVLPVPPIRLRAVGHVVGVGPRRHQLVALALQESVGVVRGGNDGGEKDEGCAAVQPSSSSAAAVVVEAGAEDGAGVDPGWRSGRQGGAEVGRAGGQEVERHGVGVDGVVAFHGGLGFPESALPEPEAGGRRGGGATQRRAAGAGASEEAAADSGKDGGVRWVWKRR